VHLVREEEEVIVTKEQEQASTQLLRAFIRCKQAGLSAGIYDGTVCVWPKETDPHKNGDFFGHIDLVGRTFNIPGMSLDGGAGT
jgi:hypothetical protein